MTRWTFADIPSQGGRSAIVTGASRGLGFEIALALAKAGADVILATRDLERGRLAAEKIAAQVQTDVSFRRLDLSDLASVAELAEGMASRSAVDLLINNAGVMALPARKAGVARVPPQAWPAGALSAEARDGLATSATTEALRRLLSPGPCMMSERR